MIRKRAYSYSAKVGYLNTQDDMYQELVIATLKCLEYRGNMEEGDFLNYLSTALKQKMMDLISKEDTHRFHTKAFNGDFQSYTNPSLSQINLNLTLKAIENDINKLHVQHHIKEQLCEIVRFHLIYNEPRRCSHVKLRINPNTLKHRYKLLRKIFRRYYDFNYLKKFSDFTTKEKKRVWKDLQTMKIDDVAFKHSIKRTALPPFITEMSKKQKRRYGSSPKRPFLNEIKVLIKKYSKIRPYSQMAMAVKNELFETFNCDETYSRIYHMVLRAR